MARLQRRMVLLVATVAVLGGCGGNGAGNDTNGKQAAVTTAAGIPTTTAAAAASPTTTARAGAAYSFRGMTITLRPGWRLDADKDGAVIANGAACVKSKLLGQRCPGFTVDGPVGIASAYENRPYRPDQIYHPGTDVSPCLTAPDDGYEDTGRSSLAKGGFAKIGTRTAIYREWQLSCVGQRDPYRPVGTPYRQRIWYLPRSQILIVDQWSTPRLADTLAAATWR
jgi:hypothetical protein